MMQVRNGCYYLLFSLFLLLSLSSVAQEICDNGKDDDGDGLIDLQDPDCQCHFNAPGNLLQNGSFEAFDHCPSAYSFDADSKLVHGWQYGTYTNENEADYYHNFSCAFDSGLVTLYAPPARPLPDGKAFVAIRQYVYRKPDFKETDVAKIYIGQCLGAPLKAGTPYTLSFNAGRFQSNDDSAFRYKLEPFTVAVFGNKDCNAAPFGKRYAKSNGCPANYAGWILLGKTTLHSKGAWVQSKINFTVPSDINVIEIGPDCSLFNPDTQLTDSTTLLDFYMYYLDDVHLLPTKEFQFPQIQNAGGGTCVADSILKAPTVANAGYQWYKNDIAIIAATNQNFHLPEQDKNGVYKVRISNEGTCSLSEPFTIQPNELAKLRLPADTALCDGDSLQLAPPLNGVHYNWNNGSGESVLVHAGGVYDIVAASDGCMRTFKITVHIFDCNNSRLYMPNAFTPNGDGKNDVFGIPPQLNFKLDVFSVYNRWGNEVFYTTKNSESWDGMSNKKKCPTATYAYFIKGTLNNRKQILKGTVLLIR